MEGVLGAQSRLPSQGLFHLPDEEIEAPGVYVTHLKSPGLSVTKPLAENL